MKILAFLARIYNRPMLARARIKLNKSKLVKPIIRFFAKEWDEIRYMDMKKAYMTGQIEEKYQIAFSDLLLKHKIKLLKEDIKIPVKFELESITDLELNVICKIAMGIKAKNIFEIGTYLGRTTVNLAYNTGKDSHIYTLNLPQKDCTFLMGKYIREHETISNKITQLIGDSKKFDYSPYFNKIDLFFIDGGHNYISVLNDGEKALKCVRKGGFIIWHDFDFTHLGSSRAIIEICIKNRLKLNKIDDTKLAIVKI